MGAIEDSVALNTGDGRNEDLVDKACEQSITSQAAQNVSTDTNDREAKAMKEPDDPTGINNLLYSLHFVIVNLFLLPHLLYIHVESMSYFIDPSSS